MLGGANVERGCGKVKRPTHRIAGVYAGPGDGDRAFHRLRRAFSERSSFLVNLAWDERFRTVRSDPRFGRLVRAIGLPGSVGRRGATR